MKGKTKLFIILMTVMLTVSAFGFVSESSVKALNAKNIHKTSSANQSNANHFHLFKTADGFERVEWDSNLYVEKYSNDFKLKSARKIDVQTILPSGCSKKDTVFGTAYEGANYNFICTGRNNPAQSKDLITLRVAKFDKNWQFLGACEMNDQCGVEIYEVFDFGICKMEELGDTLYISTGRTGFGKNDLHHQGKLNVLIRISDMAYLGSASDFMHSFDQYLTVCNGKMYQMELSEGNRCVYAEELDPVSYTGLTPDSAWTSNAAAGSGQHKIKEVFNFWTMSRPGGMWSYNLGGSTGGFASSDSQNRLLCVGYAVNQDKMNSTKGEADHLVGNIWVRSLNAEISRDTGQKNTEDEDSYLTSTDEFGFWEDDEIYEDVSDLRSSNLTNYADGGKNSARDPHLVKINDNRFLVIWEYQDNKLAYAYIDAYGQKTSAIYKMTGDLSGSEPMSDGQGNVIWYAPNNYPAFYTIRADGRSTCKALGPLAKYATFIQGKAEYIVTKSSLKNAEVAIDYIDAKAKSITVPDTIKYCGFTYKVTGVRMLSSNKLKKITLGKNVQSIDRYAFYNCRHLKNVTLKSKKLKKIGSYAFNRKMKIKVPKTKKKAYKKLLKKSGFNGKVVS